jgi:hypothetical protein
VKRATKAERRAAERFARDAIARGDAACPDGRGDLPPGATHEIVEQREGEPPTIRRRRFRIF